MKRAVALLPFFLLTACGLRSVRPGAGALDEAPGLIRRELSRRAPSARGATLAAPRTLARFYAARNWAPAWVDARGPLPAADEMLLVVRQAGLEGLDPADYHLSALLSAKRSFDPAETGETRLRADRVAELDILLSDAFLLYGCHMLVGRPEEANNDAMWARARRKKDLIATLDEAVTRQSVRPALAQLTPSAPAYAGLRRALERYRRIAAAGGWPSVPGGRAMKAGDRGSRVLALRRRLTAEGYSTDGGRPDLYEASLAGAVREFQRRNGLAADGAAGVETLREMNTPVADRIHQIKFAMNRWRRLPFELGPRYIYVNLPEFRLYAVDGGSVALSMPVVIGKEGEDTATPDFSDSITAVEFSPYWNVTTAVALREIIPEIAKDPSYLVRNHMEVLDGPNLDAKPVDPAAVAWSSVTASNWRYRLRQRPGAHNSVGAVKFVLPNDYRVFIHGTPNEALLLERRRAFSHGCIRVGRPEMLARFVLDDPAWTPERLREATRRSQPLVVPLVRPVPVHLLYFTAWIDDQAVVHFRPDIYGSDQRLKEILYGVTPDAAQGPAPSAAP